MKRTILISVAILLAVSFFVIESAFANEKVNKNYIVLDENGDYELVKVKKGVEAGAYLGVYMEDLCKKDIKEYNYPKKIGILITKVMEDSPAEEAGLQDNDIIYLFEDREVDDAKRFSKMVRKKKPGDRVSIVFYRDGKEKKVEAVLGEHPMQFYSIDWDNVGDYAKDIGEYVGQIGKSVGHLMRYSFGPKGKLGLQLSELNEDLAEYFKVKEDEGVLVMQVLEDSPAEEGGIKAGDVITSINGKKVSSMEDVIDEVSDLDEGDKVEVEVVRKGDKKTIKLEIEEDYWGEHYIFSPRRRDYRIGLPGMKHIESIEVPEVEIDKATLKAQIKELQKEIKELEKRLRKLEKD